jgi:hypothetical protein
MSASRYSSAAAEKETETERPTAQQRLDAQNAAAWSRWADQVNEKLAGLDAFYEALMGGEDKSQVPGLLWICSGKPTTTCTPRRRRPARRSATP